MKKLIAFLFVTFALALSVFATTIKNGQTYGGGVGVHFSGSNPTVRWWITVTDEDTTQRSPKAPGKKEGKGLKSGDEVNAPNGETYRVRRGRLQRKTVNPAGVTLWVNEKPIKDSGQTNGEDGGTLPS